MNHTQQASDPQDWSDLSSELPKLLRQCLRKCWETVPPAKRNKMHVESQFRRLVDRALRDMREDAIEFDFEKSEGTEEGH